MQCANQTTSTLTTLALAGHRHSSHKPGTSLVVIPFVIPVEKRIDREPSDEAHHDILPCMVVTTSNLNSKTPLLRARPSWHSWDSLQPSHSHNHHIGLGHATEKQTPWADQRVVISKVGGPQICKFRKSQIRKFADRSMMLQFADLRFTNL